MVSWLVPRRLARSSIMSTRILILTILVALRALSAGVTRADNLFLRAQPTGYECSLTITGPQDFSIFVIHGLNDGALASQWMIDDATDIARTGTSSIYLTIGDPYTDVGVAYGGCITGDHVILTLNYAAIADDVELPCTKIRIVSAPTSPIPGEVAVVNCSENLEVVNTEHTSFFINPDVSRPEGCGCLSVGVRSSTWGGIRSLYR